MTTKHQSTRVEHENLLLDDHLEKLRDPADKLLAAALRDGTYRLASRCHACGAWLVHPASIKRHMGPVCAKRAQQCGAA
nr:DUF6011 domain-containing protein [Rhodococcus sp. 15-649-1-2]